MKCAECNLWWADFPDVPCSCHADPDWPAPCEYEDADEIETDDDWGFSPSGGYDIWD